MSLYDEIRAGLTRVKCGWDLCMGCEFCEVNRHDGGRTFRCTKSWGMNVGSALYYEWHDMRGFFKVAPNCPKLIEFLVMANDKSFFEKRDIDRCRTCKHFRDMRLNAAELIAKGLFRNGLVCYGCANMPGSLFLAVFSKDEFVELGIAGSCNYKPR